METKENKNSNAAERVSVSFENKFIAFIFGMCMLYIAISVVTIFFFAFIGRVY